ncbi:MAG: single-stranded-DNA-specific exonuclease RecJ [Pelagibacteraceae bacterium]|nr:single-stranded-DNA-specific exonuclease RecJ [Pelagibacteraceae bacterium]MCI5079221.1 single-stranded-DNA-specific exonuclease RecJ [Pelagibacteraceae bacterium]
MSNHSVQGKEWVLKDFDKNLAEYISKEHDLDFLTSRLLANRNIHQKNIENFLNPKIKNFLPNPYNFKDMGKGLETISRHIKNKNKICIFGDYDVDGATSSGIMSKYLEQLNIDHFVFIPDRQKDGYGPSVKTFTNIINKNVNLIIALDCGTTSFEAIEYARSKNIDVVVIDHHKSQETFPAANAIINPNRIDETGDYYYLCAAGVLFIFLVGLNKILRENYYFNKAKVQEPNLLDLLDLVMMGTVCDVVPLMDLNRAFVYQGLKVASKRNNLGLKTLVDYSKIKKKLSTYEVGYVLGPKINAGGRIGKSELGYNLLTTNNAETAYLISSELESLNLKRKDIEKKIVEEAITIAEKYNDEPIVFLSKNDWHEGLIGIVASRLKDHFNKPSFIISQKGEDCKGSARSIFGFDVGIAITKCKQLDIITKGGGHPMAGGFSLKSDKIQIFKNELIKLFLKLKKNKDNNIIEIDSYLESSAINDELIEKLNHLEPYGSGNREPIFGFEKFKVSKVIETNNNHVKVVLNKGNFYIDAISFNSKNKDLGNYLMNFKKEFNLVAKIKLNEWNGKSKIELIIDDIQLIN